MMPGAIARISSVGFMNTWIKRLGTASVTAVQKMANTATVPRAYLSAVLMRSPCPAPKLAEKMG